MSNKLGAGSVVAVPAGTHLLPATDESAELVLTAPARFEIVKAAYVEIDTADSSKAMLLEDVSARSMDPIQATYTDSPATFERAVGGLAVTLPVGAVTLESVSMTSDAALRSLVGQAATGKGFFDHVGEYKWWILGGAAVLGGAYLWYMNSKKSLPTSGLGSSSVSHNRYMSDLVKEAAQRQFDRAAEIDYDDDLRSCYASDGRDLLKLARMIRAGDKEKASKFADRLDTIVRDSIPEEVYRNLFPWK